MYVKISSKVYIYIHSIYNMYIYYTYFKINSKVHILKS